MNNIARANGLKCVPATRELVVLLPECCCRRRRHRRPHRHHCHHIGYNISHSFSFFTFFENVLPHLSYSVPFDLYLCQVCSMHSPIHIPYSIRSSLLAAIETFWEGSYVPDWITYALCSDLRAVFIAFWPAITPIHREQNQLREFSRSNETCIHFGEILPGGGQKCCCGWVRARSVL